MGNYFFVAGIPMVTLYSSRFTSQSIEITTDGILVDSMAGKEFMPWESLTSMELSDEYVPVGRMGTMVPKQLQKRLKLVDTSERYIMVNEPQLSSVKRRIIKKFQEYAPDSVREKILDPLEGW
ncbi:MAG: hypothetical protein K9N21_22555 [Deltaproteobacteria bacterium]|nr:hypothetical protein [Deltaproteobacteria bacterium]